MEDDLSMLTSHLVAHCGLVSEDAPENSLRAFQRAVDAGFAIELDVHLTQEGEVVVFHDHTLTRMCQRSSRVEDLTRRTRLLSHLSKTDQVIPTLRDVLDLVDGRVPLFVEVKPRQALKALSSREARRTIEAVARVLEGYDGPVAVMAWDPRQLRWLQRNAPRVIRVQSSGVGSAVLLLPGMGFLFDDLKVTWLSNPHAISYNAALLPRASVEAVRHAGRPVVAWVARSPQVMAQTLTHADNVVFDNFVPDVTSPSGVEPSTVLPSRLRSVKDTARSLPGWRPRRTVRSLVPIVPLVVGGVAGRYWSATSKRGVVSLVAAGMLAAWQPRQWGRMAVSVSASQVAANLDSPGKAVRGSLVALGGAVVGASLRALLSVDDSFTGREESSVTSPSSQGALAEGPTTSD